jgi:hypothetical protein
MACNPRKSHELIFIVLNTPNGVYVQRYAYGIFSAQPSWLPMMTETKMRTLTDMHSSQVSGGGTQVFDDGSTLTTDDNGNIVSCTDSSGNPYYAGGIGGMMGPGNTVLVPNGCTITGGSTSVTNNPQTTATTYALGITSGPAVSTVVTSPSTTSTQTINYTCPPNFR